MGGISNAQMYVRTGERTFSIKGEPEKAGKRERDRRASRILSVRKRIPMIRWILSENEKKKLSIR